MRRSEARSAVVRNSSGSLTVDQYLNGNPEIQCRILDAAAQLFRLHGFSTVTMQDIGQAVGLSKAGLYHHCPSKERLLADIVRVAGELLLRQLEEIRASPESAGQRVRAFVVTRMETIARHQDLFTVVWQERPFINRSDFADIAKKAEAYRTGVRRLIEEAIAAKEIHVNVDPHLLMLAIDGMTGWAYLWYRRKGSKSPRELGEMFWSYIAEGVLSDSARERM